LACGQSVDGEFVHTAKLFCGLRFKKRKNFGIVAFMKKDDTQPGFVHIGNVIDGVLKNYRSKPDFELTEIWRLWDEAVGATIAQNARPAAFKGQLLIVHVISSTWIHQLQFLKNDLMAKINDALGKPLIQEIKFKIGPLR
jgi:hypothetical protein